MSALRVVGGWKIGTEPLVIVKHSFDLRRKGGISTSVKWHARKFSWVWCDMDQE
jgi:hypothetical protein